jgi:hypothetical protein
MYKSLPPVPVLSQIDQFMFPIPLIEDFDQEFTEEK